MLYKVNEIFYSIQGEGFWTGRAAVFIRLAGCNLNCEWCDTDYSYITDHTEQSIVAKVFELIHKREQHRTPVPMVVITGGEPTLQDLNDLVCALKSNAFYIAIETNGTNPEKIHPRINHITVSPKVEGNYSMWPVIGPKIDELKVVLDHQVDPRYFRKFFDAQNYYIQPMSEDFEPAIKFVKENPKWRLSIQTQKLINIR